MHIFKGLDLFGRGQFSFLSAYLMKNCYTCLPHIHIDVFTLPPSDCWIAFNSMTLHSFYVEHYMWERFTANITFKTRLGSNSKPYVHKVFSISLTIFLVVRNLLSPIQDIPTDSRVQGTYCKQQHKIQPLTSNALLAILQNLIYLQPLRRTSNRHLSLKVCLPSIKSILTSTRLQNQSYYFGRNYSISPSP